MENDVRDTIQNENAPLVSISVIAYNHEKYIRQCLDGILMQKVDFPYEVLVHDDASPDGTADIIREYEAKYPDIIKPIYQTENQYSKVGIGAISRFNDERARGKYIAQCEGDDYWTDPDKLQMQVDFLEAHPEYVGTAHSVTVINDNEEIIYIEGLSNVKRCVFTRKEYEEYAFPGHLGSWVFRNIFLTISSNIKDRYYSYKSNADIKLSLLLILMGNIYCFSRSMSVYRRILMTGTSWSARMKNQNITYEQFLQRRDRNKFAQEFFNVELDKKRMYITIPISLIFIIKKPSINNIIIALKIIINMPEKRNASFYFLKIMTNRVQRSLNVLLTYLK